MITPETMYNSVRQEVLDQKKCQFQLFGACVTLTAAILAYAATSAVSPSVYVAPILINALGCTIILDKAISIQRMVGYLQLMERKPGMCTWMWEYHLSKFRSLPGKSQGLEGFRRHKYVLTVASMLMTMNVLCAALYYWGPSAKALRTSEDFAQVAEFYGAVNLVVALFVLGGVGVTIGRWCQLMFGKSTGKAIGSRWVEAIEAVRNENTA